MPTGRDDTSVPLGAYQPSWVTSRSSLVLKVKPTELGYRLPGDDETEENDEVSPEEAAYLGGDDEEEPRDPIAAEG